MPLGVVYEDGKLMIKQIDEPSKEEKSVQEETEPMPVEKKAGFFDWIRRLI